MRLVFARCTVDSLATDAVRVVDSFVIVVVDALVVSVASSLPLPFATRPNFTMVLLTLLFPTTHHRIAVQGDLS